MLKVIKIALSFVLVVSSLMVYADDEDNEMPDASQDTIQITVTMEGDDVAGVGYIVDGVKYGSSGKMFSGTGPKGKVYTFGYRKIHRTSTRIDCGKMRLDQDSHIVLTIEGMVCHSKLEKTPAPK